MRPSNKKESCNGQLHDLGPEAAMAAGSSFLPSGKPRAASLLRTGSPGIPTLRTHLKTVLEQQ